MQNRTSIDSKEPEFGSYGNDIAISLTSRCPLKCAHCISDSGPDRQSHIDLSDAALDSFLLELDAPGSVLSKRLKFITLTGGEAVLRADLVSRTVAAAGRHGIRVGLMTSGYWAKSREAAARFLFRLGHIQMMTISTDLEHLRFVPLDWVRNAFDVSEDAGIVTHVRLTRAAIYNDREELLEEALRQEFCERLEIQHLVPWGRGETYAPAERKAPEALANIPTLACPSNGHHILESGHVIPCCNTIVGLPPQHSLVLGNINNDTFTDVVQRSETNVLLLYIRLFGFTPIVEALQEAGYDVSNDDISPCHICAVLLKTKELNDFISRWVLLPDNILHVCAALMPMVKSDFDLRAITVQVNRDNIGDLIRRSS